MRLWDDEEVETTLLLAVPCEAVVGAVAAVVAGEAVVLSSRVLLMSVTLAVMLLTMVSIGSMVFCTNDASVIVPVVWARPGCSPKS